MTATMLYRVSYGLTIIVLLVIISALIYKVTGHSPAALDLVIGLQIATLAALFTCCMRFSEFKGRTEEFMKNTRQEFVTAGAQMKRVQSDLAEIKQVLIRKKIT